MVDKLDHRGGHSPEQRERGPAEKIEKKQEESRELRETSKEFVEGVSEVVETIETGEVSEKTGEDKKRGPQGQFPIKDDGKRVKVELKPIDYPMIEVMRIQIATEIKKEIVGLVREAARVSNNPFALNAVITKVRSLKDILSDLTHITLEKLKDLWLKFVKKT